MDSYFDMPAGYNDADLEMAALEQRGNQYARRYRGFTHDQVTDLAAGRTVLVKRVAKETGERYWVAVKALDADNLGPCDLRYSIEGTDWHPTSKAARLAASGEVN